MTLWPSSSSVVGVTLWQRASAKTRSRTREPISRRVLVVEVPAAVMRYVDDGVIKDEAWRASDDADVEKP